MTFPVGYNFVNVNQLGDKAARKKRKLAGKSDRKLSRKNMMLISLNA